MHVSHIDKATEGRLKIVMEIISWFLIRCPNCRRQCIIKKAGVVSERVWIDHMYHTITLSLILLGSYVVTRRQGCPLTNW